MKNPFKLKSCEPVERQAEAEEILAGILNHRIGSRRNGGTILELLAFQLEDATNKHGLEAAKSIHQVMTDILADLINSLLQFKANGDFRAYSKIELKTLKRQKLKCEQAQALLTGIDDAPLHKILAARLRLYSQLLGNEKHQASYLGLYVNADLLLNGCAKHASKEAVFHFISEMLNEVSDSYIDQATLKKRIQRLQSWDDESRS